MIKQEWKGHNFDTRKKSLGKRINIWIPHIDLEKNIKCIHKKNDQCKFLFGQESPGLKSGEHRKPIFFEDIIKDIKEYIQKGQWDNYKFLFLSKEELLQNGYDLEDISGLEEVGYFNKIYDTTN